MLQSKRSSPRESMMKDESNEVFLVNVRFRQRGSLSDVADFDLFGEGKNDLFSL